MRKKRAKQLKQIFEQAMNRLTAEEYNKVNLNKAFRHVKDAYTRGKAPHKLNKAGF
jgi:hypothetical protein